MLIGIVEKNAIMQIDFALEAEREQNLTAERAIYEGCLIRFRPIMMTTMAALVGAVPIALRLRRGRRGAATAGTGGGRRTAVLAVSDALPHAGFLHLSCPRCRIRVNSWRRRGKKAPRIAHEAPVASH
jgi:hypothetical protein